ncbi:hypothetical protein RhiirA1_482285 [Rhizophagus irregularis]|uniref:Uncharacterized protein n=1 Tax=Rhizophagus irregularis TaxID=588596 RepID=A0A2N0QM11_9GLOM|nr:hypothetical protein RhiirA1_482285 [Rhizophagus irregularis]
MAHCNDKVSGNIEFEGSGSGEFKRSGSVRFEKSSIQESKARKSLSNLIIE